MIILGIDPGTANLGTCVLDSARMSILTYNNTRVHNYTDLYTFIKDYIVGYCVTHVAIEKPFFTSATLTSNVGTLEVIGIIKYCLEEFPSVTMKQYSPAHIKKVFTGNGKADKKDIIKEAQSKYGIETKVTHVADAIAIADTLLSDYNDLIRVH